MSDHTVPGVEGIQMAAASTWTGTPTTLQVNDQVTMPQTPNGTVIVAALNKTTGNNQGEITITSGGSTVDDQLLDAGETAPWALNHNYQANNLTITNVSANDSTPILVQAIGPGIPGVTPKSLVIGTPLPLAFGEVAQGGTKPQNMQLKVQVNSPTTAVVGVIGGPLTNGENGKVIGVNWPVDRPKPDNYFAVTSQNTYTLNFNWNGGQIFVGNLSSSNADSVSLTLRAI